MPQSTPPQIAISFGDTFVASEGFKALFREGMALVEDTAAYLDGPGRQQARFLSRNAAVAYASESMRLTTRLMQIASWLLLQRALAEGELSLAEARSQRNRVRLSGQDVIASPDGFGELPLELRDLVGHSLRLQGRVLHLDRLVENRPDMPETGANMVAVQQQLLASAFGSEGR